MASTGANEAALQRAGITDFEVVRLHPGHHVGKHEVMEVLMLRVNEGGKGVEMKEPEEIIQQPCSSSSSFCFPYFSHFILSPSPLFFSFFFLFFFLLFCLFFLPARLLPGGAPDSHESVFQQAHGQGLRRPGRRRNGHCAAHRHCVKFVSCCALGRA